MSVVTRGFAPKQAAQYLGISEQTLRKQRSAGHQIGRMPVVPYLRAGRRIVYLREQLDAWLEARRAEGSPAPGTYDARNAFVAPVTAVDERAE